MKTKIISVILALTIILSYSVVGFAADTQKGEPYSKLAHIVDDAFGVAHDGLFALVQGLTPKGEIYDENYVPEYFYKGTPDGMAFGDSWKGGFANHSIIPTSWRCDANGNPNPNGMCLNKKYATGGYQTKVSKLYTDQMMNIVILSNKSDSNNNGKDDVVIFISIDGVGVTAGTVYKIRENVQKALTDNYGLVKGDILACNVSATHCHAALDVQGMCITTLFNNKIKNFNKGYIRSLEEDMENSIESAAYTAAKEAYGKIEDGQLLFFQTDETDGCNDKLHAGMNTVNYFSCFLFKGTKESTILSNIGGHPTSYGAWDDRQLMCADYPYFMSMALKDMGYNLVFTQSSQASVTSPCIDDETWDADADAWVEKKALSKEDWVNMYGQKYADKWYPDLEDTMHEHMHKAYKLAKFIVSFIDKGEEVYPGVNVYNQMTTISLDYGVMSWGAVSGLLGENAIKLPGSETGYGLRVETDFIELGFDVAILTAPGELTPTLTYGTDPNYDGEALWTGKTSWTGESWKDDLGYDTLENIAKSYVGSEETILFMGITNDALGYMFPDICVTKSILGAMLCYKENPEDMSNSMLMTVSTKVGSELVKAYTEILKTVSTPK